MTQAKPRSSKEPKRNRHKHQPPKRPPQQDKRVSFHRDQAQLKKAVIKAIETIDTAKTQSTSVATIEAIDTVKIVSISTPTSSNDQRQDAHAPFLAKATTATLPIDSIDTIKTPTIAQKLFVEQKRISETQPYKIRRLSAFSLLLLLAILVLRATPFNQSNFLGTEGWASMLNPTSQNDPNLLKGIGHATAKPGAATTPVPLTPQAYIDTIINRMSLDQKLGQMMIIQFVGPSYSPDLSAMISQYGIGAVLIFSANQNIQDKVQLRSLIQQMQSNSTVPLAVAIDQEGGVVDRLVSLDGPRPSEASIGATNDTTKATAAGLQDAKDLASYGINLNLAPVVDVTNVYNSQLDTRTYGNNPDLVTKLAAAYLQGLQQSGKVLGTLKHFPGLGDVAVDPHVGVPTLSRSLTNLQNIDWAPYRTLIQQGNVHAIMVTHELVTSVDGTQPSSLSKKVVTGILRQQLGFQGVIMTDSLTMEGILAYATESQAAAMAVEAGSDLLMGASTPSDVASMVEGIKHAISNGEISQQQIDDSVRRILMLKYAMGLLPVPSN